MTPLQSEAVKRLIDMVKTDVMGFDDLTGCQHTYAEALKNSRCHYHEMAIKVYELEHILAL